ncbi:Ig domain-containing protein [Reinekea marinisedimentorum]|uniref:Uncharacterized protein n=1 Tax=Reinekea marinisedimentorum TaxID=230495 RepID=A0A4R3I0D7_9GAMM|nr:Ig domain-containing protein [Reinekea marinisedimentorum]TCS38988.1 hypothetical protein BCF53_11334 [Reinekea marinisedimentorum]
MMRYSALALTLAMIGCSGDSLTGDQKSTVTATTELTEPLQFLGSTDHEVVSVSGGATWVQDDSGDYVYDNNGTTYTKRAILYSAESFQSDSGFRLTVEYTTGTIADSAAHNFSFGLVSDETDLANYSGFNPFSAETSVYSLGVNLTAADGTDFRGLNFANATEVVSLDESGTRVQFATGEPTTVTLEIGIGGSYNYRINDEFEASGVLVDGFDSSKNYHVVVYGQDDHGGGKSIQSISLEKAPAAGERAAGLRGTWYSGIHPTLIDDRLKSLKTLDGFGVGLTDGASLSAQHYGPSKLIESLDGGDEVVPTWGDLSLDDPETDDVMDYINIIKDAGFKVKMYTNSENFVGTNQDQFVEFVESWMAYCDTDPDVQAFINSQPYHTGIWNSATGDYEDATDTYPLRKYMFAYAEYMLKEYSLRYGPYVDSWIFDDGATMEDMGDSATSGLIEEQRIYQAFADAARAGNPDIPVAFNNGRSTVNYNSYPFAHAVQFDDFTFGHAFGGNNNHAEKVDGNQFNLNYQHITRMTDTNGYVHADGNWAWDDLIVGNFHSKLSTTAWKYGPNQAWEQDDFNQWSLEAMQAGGSMTWDGSYNRTITTVYDWVYVLLEGTDEYLMAYESPGAPNWARGSTPLPTAYLGESYSHELTEGDDFWDPEGDEIIQLRIVDTDSAPAWLSVEKTDTGVWTLSGVPTESEAAAYEFSLEIADASGATSRSVELLVE